MIEAATIETKYQALSGRLDEAAFACMGGGGGAQSGAWRSESCCEGDRHVAHNPFMRDCVNLKDGACEPPSNKAGVKPRVRVAGGGRKRLVDKDASLLKDLGRIG